MPRYFFHVYDEAELRDDEGLDLPDAAAAHAEAVRGARSLASEQVTMGRLALHHRIDVADERGHLVASIAFAMRWR